jgi:hypothetical protein
MDRTKMSLVENVERGTNGVLARIPRGWIVLAAALLAWAAVLGTIWGVSHLGAFVLAHIHGVGGA